MVCRTVTFYEDGGWPSGVDTFDERHYVNSRVARFPHRLQALVRRWYEFQFALRLLRFSKGCPAVAVGRFGLWFPVVQHVLRLGKRVVLTDVEWPKVKSGYFNRLAVKGSSAVCVFTRQEMERYSKQYGIPRDKFRLVPAPFELRHLRESSDEGYIFSGGFQARDWPTVVHAVADLPYPVKILSRDPVPDPSPNISVSCVSAEEYYGLIARASCVAIALYPEPMRMTGMATYVAAMAMGKTVVVADHLGAPDYIEHGVSGFYVEYGDWRRMRHYIGAVMADAELRRRVGQAAKERAWRECSPEAFRRHILALLRPDRSTSDSTAG